MQLHQGRSRKLGWRRKAGLQWLPTSAGPAMGAGRDKLKTEASKVASTRAKTIKEEHPAASLAPVAEEVAESATEVNGKPAASEQAAHLFDSVQGEEDIVMLIVKDLQGSKVQVKLKKRTPLRKTQRCVLRKTRSPGFKGALRGRQRADC
eukprot:TRINITY_DN82126_c0_g1_i1.p2 TRINITY_DN82126_c0_g1~~TRINITY_DN82126_c0_g1_i1.p2  ORF type:complete len:150 (-),score=34.03 TRINITY_DN82126_c0_g1_i1:317-766(-)